MSIQTSTFNINGKTCHLSINQAASNQTKSHSTTNQTIATLSILTPRWETIKSQLCHLIGRPHHFAPLLNSQRVILVTDNIHKSQIPLR